MGKRFILKLGQHWQQYWRFFPLSYWININYNIGRIIIANIKPIMGKRFILKLGQHWQQYWRFFPLSYWININYNIGRIIIANIKPILGKRFILISAQYWRQYATKIGCNIGHTLVQYILLLGQICVMQSFANMTDAATFLHLALL
jgi:hypothetical protein